MSCWTKRCGSRKYTRPRYAASRPTNVKTVETETSAAFCNRAFIKSTSDQGRRHVTLDNLRVRAASGRPVPFGAHPCATGASRPLSTPCSSASFWGGHRWLPADRRRFVMLPQHNELWHFVPYVTAVVLF